MREVALRGVAYEVRDVFRAIRGEFSHSSSGSVVVSGMLAEQLARELGAGAEPGSVVVGEQGRLTGAAAVVRVMAGDPRAEDDELVRTADGLGVPVVLVQLWPQADWTPPFVLSPHVVECRAGQGFPIREIADRIAESSERSSALAARIPALEPAVATRVMRVATIRAALVGAAGGLMGASRPLIVLEQVRMLAQLVSYKPGPVRPQVVAGIATAGLVVGFGLRGVARAARGTLPAPVVNSAVAAGATWMLGAAARRLAEAEATSH